MEEFSPSSIQSIFRVTNPGCLQIYKHRHPLHIRHLDHHLHRPEVFKGIAYDFHIPVRISLSLKCISLVQVNSFQPQTAGTRRHLRRMCSSDNKSQKGRSDTLSENLISGTGNRLYTKQIFMFPQLFLSFWSSRYMHKLALLMYIFNTALLHIVTVITGLKSTKTHSQIMLRISLHLLHITRNLHLGRCFYPKQLALH